MGIDIDTWRRRIGCSSQPSKQVNPLKTLNTKHISLCLRVCLFYLLNVQGVESSPCPVDGDGPQPGGGAGRFGSST